MSSEPTIIVTGGAGFIGSNFIHTWLETCEGIVVNLDKLTYAGNFESLSPLAENPRHIFVKGDIGDRQLVSTLLEDYRPWAIINFAAESHVDRSISAPDDFIQTNVVGTFNLLQQVRNYWEGMTAEKESTFRFLHVSTDEVYGSLNKLDPAFSETTPYSPNSPYSASKAGSDHLVRAYHHTYGLPTLTTNCSNNYGPYQFPEKLIPLVIHNALNGKLIPVYGDGSNIRDWLYVKDHCRAIMAVMEKGKPGEVYNIGGNSEKTNLEVVHAICAILDELSPFADQRRYETLITFVTDRPGHDQRYAIDASKIKNEIGWAPEETFETGIRKTVRWYLDNTQWVTNVTSGAYRTWIETNYGKR
ncbi:MAG: dTDP-glucose 4,6-dehydratase [Desulfosarcina sp.]|nr:dTDP-glucose 4,6-dehydratase [Desulfosarcina sp.]MBC2764928.1 dTDP-glucose 4,6-dehydratase [Desulfosarcina sp.]